MKIYYGKTKYADVSSILEKGVPLFIPASDDIRWRIFGNDPESGVLKEIRVIDDYGRFEVFKNDISFSIEKDANDKLIVKKNYEEILKEMQKTMKLKHGTFDDEYPEQLMSVCFIKPWMKVLEIGGNIGRNTCVISKLLKDSSQLTVVESDPESVNKLYDNRKLNNFNFTVIDGAITRKRMIQNNWITTYLENSTLPDGWKLVNNIDWNNVQYRHGPFDALVADCEGSLFYILQENPTFFNNFSLVIMENDFTIFDHKKVVDAALTEAGLKVVYEKPGGWGLFENCFFQVWQK
jgi:FkbM family methyltransferase